MAATRSASCRPCVRASVRSHIKLLELEEKRPGQWQQTNEVTVEIEGEGKTRPDRRMDQPVFRLTEFIRLTSPKR